MMWWWVPCKISVRGNRIGTVQVALELKLFGNRFDLELGVVSPKHVARSHWICKKMAVPRVF